MARSLSLSATRITCSLPLYSPVYILYTRTRSREHTALSFFPQRNIMYYYYTSRAHELPINARRFFFSRPLFSGGGVWTNDSTHTLSNEKKNHCIYNISLKKKREEDDKEVKEERSKVKLQVEKVSSGQAKRARSTDHSLLHPLQEMHSPTQSNGCTCDMCAPTRNEHPPSACGWGCCRGRERPLLLLLLSFAFTLVALRCCCTFSSSSSSSCTYISRYTPRMCYMYIRDHRSRSD